MRAKLRIVFASVMLLLSLLGCAKTNEAAESSPRETVVYEAVFLDNGEILDLFESVRGEVPPFDNVTAYAVQDIKMDDGQMTSNEGFKVDVASGNKELATYLDALDKNYHITGAYKDGAKYTEYIDFSAGDPMDTYIVGTFGGYYSDGTINLGEK